MAAPAAAPHAPTELPHADSLPANAVPAAAMPPLPPLRTSTSEPAVVVESPRRRRLASRSSLFSLIADAGARSRRSLVSAAPPRPHVIADAVAVGGAGDGRPTGRTRRSGSAATRRRRRRCTCPRRRRCPRHPLPNGLFRGVRGRARAHTMRRRWPDEPAPRRGGSGRSGTAARSGARAAAAGLCSSSSKLSLAVSTAARARPRAAAGAVDHAAAQASIVERDEYIVRGRDGRRNVFAWRTGRGSWIGRRGVCDAL